MRKTTLLTISLTFLVVLPATAQLGSVWTDFQSYAGDLQTYLTNNLTDTLKPIESEAQSAINNATGELNIPNPIAAGQNVRDGMVWYYISDKFDNNATVRANLASNEVNRLITRGAVASVMGEDGQIRLKTKLEETERNLREVDEYSEETDKISNDLLQEARNIANTIANTTPLGQISALLGINQSTLQQQSIRIQRDQLKITGENLGQTMQMNQFMQYSNLNLANISQQVEEANRARRVDTSAEAARLLRTTSQIDLFGRTEEN
ncbi:hypothetical protein ACF3DV_20185 [Chlorogloeopsis fritschii PCC 9212]|uniref:Uncharacterized protein n=1 Tax=Chlorogloeopsis fritschii PCC 6912 TaxID=211165 RepID=A0A433NN43_CHLFR|nr:hypothetical protein [Chlorogloeopsis fritschii]RUR84621.1 hypothetical protein PCC6912_15160 [Chlorogloeopsis fritschii PCC 6912]